VGESADGIPDVEAWQLTPLLAVISSGDMELSPLTIAQTSTTASFVRPRSDTTLDKPRLYTNRWPAAWVGDVERNPQNKRRSGYLVQSGPNVISANQFDTNKSTDLDLVWSLQVHCTGIGFATLRVIDRAVECYFSSQSHI
jgi:hypothetical protein